MREKENGIRQPGLDSGLIDLERSTACSHSFSRGKAPRDLVSTSTQPQKNPHAARADHITALVIMTVVLESFVSQDKAKSVSELVTIQRLRLVTYPSLPATMECRPRARDYAASHTMWNGDVDLKNFREMRRPWSTCTLNWQVREYRLRRAIEKSLRIIEDAVGFKTVAIGCYESDVLAVIILDSSNTYGEGISKACT